METIKGPAGFREAQKTPGEWTAKRPLDAFATTYRDNDGSGWCNWIFAQLTAPDVEWRRVPKEPMRWEASGLIVSRSEWSNEVSGLSVTLQAHSGSPWLGKRARIVVEEVTDAPAIEAAGTTYVRKDIDSPPVEMTAEEAMGWLRGAADNERVVIDRENTAWQFSSGVFWCAAWDGSYAQLPNDNVHPPYRPLAPVTKAEFEAEP